MNANVAVDADVEQHLSIPETAYPSGIYTFASNPTPDRFEVTPIYVAYRRGLHGKARNKCQEGKTMKQSTQASANASSHKMNDSIVNAAITKVPPGIKVAIRIPVNVPDNIKRRKINEIYDVLSSKNSL